MRGDFTLVAQIIEINGPATWRKGDRIVEPAHRSNLPKKLTTPTAASRNGMFENSPHSLYDAR
jgi:hypothetical protein